MKTPKQVGPRNWFVSNVQGFNELKEKEISAILYFSLLWRLFENEVCDKEASVNKILIKTQAWSDANILTRNEFQSHVDYFKDRYVDDGKFTEHFEGLLFRNKKNRALVGDMLMGKYEDDGAKVVGALLLIVYRYRNNLFHGAKWAYGLKGQLHNFSFANNLLMKAIELDRRYRKNSKGKCGQ